MTFADELIAELAKLPDWNVEVSGRVAFLFAAAGLDMRSARAGGVLALAGLTAAVDELAGSKDLPPAVAGLMSKLVAEFSAAVAHIEVDQ